MSSCPHAPALGPLLAAARSSTNPVPRSVGWGHVWLFRPTPVLLQSVLLAPVR